MTDAAIHKNRTTDYALPLKVVIARRALARRGNPQEQDG